MSPTKPQYPRTCEHCHRDLPFGEFELTKRVTGRPNNAVWSVRYNCYVQQLRRYLCAQCGFNITSYRVVRRYEVPERVEGSSGFTCVRVREIIAQDRPYLQCTLITKIEVVYDVALEADRERYYEQVKALEAQRRSKRIKRYEWNLRRIGTTIGDMQKGIEPLTEDQILEALEAYAGKVDGILSGSSRGQAREIVLGGVRPRRTAIRQRESSTSGTVPAVSASTVRPRARVRA